MKDVYEVLHQNEAALRHEIQSLHVVASLLADDLASDELTQKKENAAEDVGPWPGFKGDRNRPSSNG